MAVTPLDITSLDGTGVVLRQIACTAVHDSIDALLLGEPARIEVTSPTHNAIKDESARSYLEDLNRPGNFFPLPALSATWPRDSPYTRETIPCLRTSCPPVYKVA